MNPYHDERGRFTTGGGGGGGGGGGSKGGGGGGKSKGGEVTAASIKKHFEGKPEPSDRTRMAGVSGGGFSYKEHSKAAKEMGLNPLTRQGHAKVNAEHQQYLKDKGKKEEVQSGKRSPHTQRMLNEFDRLQTARKAGMDVSKLYGMNKQAQIEAIRTHQASQGPSVDHQATHAANQKGGDAVRQAARDRGMGREGFEKKGNYGAKGNIDEDKPAGNQHPEGKSGGGFGKTVPELDRDRVLSKEETDRHYALTGATHHGPAEEQLHASDLTPQQQRNVERSDKYGRDTTSPDYAGSREVPHPYEVKPAFQKTAAADYIAANRPGGGGSIHLNPSEVADIKEEFLSGGKGGADHPDLESNPATRGGAGPNNPATRAAGFHRGPDEGPSISQLRSAGVGKTRSISVGGSQVEVSAHAHEILQKTGSYKAAGITNTQGGRYGSSSGSGAKERWAAKNQRRSKE